MSDACSDAAPTQRVRAAGLQLAIERLERAKHAAHAHDRVASVARAAAVRRASLRLHLHPLEAFVRDGDPQLGRLGHDAGVGAPRVTSASAPMLACSSSTTHAMTMRPAASPPDSAITRAAPIIAATPPFMSCDPRP